MKTDWELQRDYEYRSDLMLDDYYAADYPYCRKGRRIGRINDDDIYFYDDNDSADNRMRDLEGKLYD